MSNQHNHNSDSDNPVSDALATAGGAVTDLLTNATIPVPIRKNVFKAFNQLCTAAIEIPVSHLEGIASEKRAETQARIKLISTSADQIASQMDVEPDYARAAVRKFGQKVIREQINLDKVAEAAAEQINQDAANAKAEQSVSEEVPPINEDWLNNFEKEASQKSTEEMQLLFGRILAGEIQRPSSFSIKTVRLLSSLDSEVAQLFRQVCSLCVVTKTHGNIGRIMDARVLSLGKDVGKNDLQDYGLTFEGISILQENDLVMSTYMSVIPFNTSIAGANMKVITPFFYHDMMMGLVSLPERQINDDLHLSGVALSRTGKEMMEVVSKEENEKYTAALHDYFKGLNLEMVECGIQ